MLKVKGKVVYEVGPYAFLVIPKGQALDTSLELSLKAITEGVEA